MGEPKDAKSLNISKDAEEFANKLDLMFSDLVTTEHFNDKEVVIDKWGISYFHLETKKAIESLIINILTTYIELTGNKVTHVIKNDLLKNRCFLQEQLFLGKKTMVTYNLESLEGMQITIIDEDNQKEVE